MQHIRNEYIQWADECLVRVLDVPGEYSANLKRIDRDNELSRAKEMHKGNSMLTHERILLAIDIAECAYALGDCARAGQYYYSCSTVKDYEEHLDSEYEEMVAHALVRILTDPALEEYRKKALEVAPHGYYFLTEEVNHIEKMYASPAPRRRRRSEYRE